MNPPPRFPEDRRSADVEFRIHMQDHVDRLEEEFRDFRATLDAYHKENMTRLISLEASAQRANGLVDEWIGTDGNEGMRKVLRQMVQERRLIGIGWKTLAAFGAIGTALVAVWQFLVAHYK
jgi:hypothetical protein